jgi:Ca2+-binding EF-hand superfamily protein
MKFFLKVIVGDDNNRVPNDYTNNIYYKAFKSIDTNGNGMVDRAELTKFLTSSGYSEDEQIQFLRRVDTNQDGQISLPEFLNNYENRRL